MIWPIYDNHRAGSDFLAYFWPRFWYQICVPKNPFPTLVLQQERPPKLAENLLKPTKAHQNLTRNALEPIKPI